MFARDVLLDVLNSFQLERHAIHEMDRIFLKERTRPQQRSGLRPRAWSFGLNIRRRISTLITVVVVVVVFTTSCALSDVLLWTVRIASPHGWCCAFARDSEITDPAYQPV